MFGRKKHEENSPEDLKQRITAQHADLWEAFENARIFPLRQALLGQFSEVLTQRVIEGGWEPGPMRDAYLDCERAWVSELPTLKMELLEFRDIGDWLDLAEKISIRGEMLDWFDKQFDGATASLRYGGAQRIGALILTFDAKTGE